ncbi:hypothetical protein EE612_035395 [Oryza sativa]|nr:hypothetical protein EE612_035395 [Oryza sativa]
MAMPPEVPHAVPPISLVRGLSTVAAVEA